MKLKQRLKEMKELNPFQYKVQVVLLPLYLALFLLPLIPVIILMEIDEKTYLPVFLVWFCLVIASSAAFLIFMLTINKKCIQTELKRWGYLFQDPAPLEDVEVTVGQMEEDDIVYTVNAEGVRGEWTPIEGEEEEQVFDEAQNTSRFVAWEDADYALATQTFYHRVYIALAVLPHEDTPQGVFTGMPFILPMNEKLFCAMHKYGIIEKTGADWAYLFYNPEDAFKQILKWGRIRKMRNKKTGKIFVDEKGNFTP